MLMRNPGRSELTRRLSRWQMGRTLTAPAPAPAIGDECSRPSPIRHVARDGPPRPSCAPSWPLAYFAVSTRGLGETLRFRATLLRTGARKAPRVHDIVLVLNDNDHTLDAAPALRLATQWRSHADVETLTYRLARELGLPHDMIDVTQRCGMPEVVFPALIALLEHRTPLEAVVEARCAPETSAR